MRNNNYFRGLNILLVGDFYQLSPVNQAALYSNLPARPLELASYGKGAYKAINQTAVLDQVIWQGGDDAKSSVFRTALVELCSDSVNKSTQKLLLTRYKQGLSTNKVAGFDDAIWLYGTRAAIGKYNTTWLRDLLQPVVAIKLVDTSVGVRKATSNQCDTIENLALCIGVKVMLIQNIWIELGLVNGTTGIVKDVIQKGYADIKKDQPQLLLIIVDGYNGPALFTWQDSKKVVPIFSVLYEWEGIRGFCLQR